MPGRRGERRRAGLWISTVIPARLRGVLTTALVIGVIAWVGLDALETRIGSPVPLPWTAPIGILIMAGVVLVAGLEVRRWVAGRRTRPLDPLMAARVAVLAKAGAYTGGGLVGWYLAQAVVLLPDLVGDRRSRFALALLSTVVSVALAATGLAGQRWCRLPPDESEDDVGSDR